MGLGLGLIHYVPMIAYIGFWIMCIVSLTGRPLLGLYYMIPFLPYRTLRDHFLDFPLGGNMLTILVVAVIIGALLKGKSIPKSSLYTIWLVFGVYLYLSMWFGTALGNAPPPLWLGDVNFETWKDYMLIPLVFIAAGMVIEDRKAVRTVVLITAVSLLAIDRSCLLESMSRSWGSFDENKRDTGPLAYGSNQTAAFLAQFAMFFWGFVQFVQRKKLRLIFYGLVALTIFADLYTFSRGSYAALLVSIVVLGFLKDRKLIVIAAVFLFTWQAIVPTAVRERVEMTQNSNGQLEISAQERVNLWEAAEQSIISNPVLGIGFATYQIGNHVDGLKDTHNWYVKVMVETGIIGMIIVLAMLQQVLAVAYRLFKRAEDPLYRGLGLGLFVAMCSCIVANFFGDRWTYLEITGILWVLVAAAIRALQLAETEPATESAISEASVATNPFLAYR
ncbi:O-antigen ligase family protein [Tunturiibacter psychrotolerans]|uniref:O-antigen ligase family protein n=1 Tax=Tunturiibacter psychrotolerans TaxID=3069686 RepID=UPI003D1ADCA7